MPLSLKKTDRIQYLRQFISPHKETLLKEKFYKMILHHKHTMIPLKCKLILKIVRVLLLPIAEARHVEKEQ